MTTTATKREPVDVTARRIIFDGTVQGSAACYLTTMVAEYEAASRHTSDPEVYGRTIAQRDAYRDALRILAIAEDAWNRATDDGPVTTRPPVGSLSRTTDERRGTTDTVAGYGFVPYGTGVRCRSCGATFARAEGSVMRSHARHCVVTPRSYDVPGVCDA